MGVVGEGHRAGRDEVLLVPQGPARMDGGLEGGWRRGGLSGMVQGEETIFKGESAGRHRQEPCLGSCWVTDWGGGGDAGICLGPVQCEGLRDIQAKLSQSRCSP